MNRYDLNDDEKKMTLKEQLEQERTSQIQIGNTTIYMSFNPDGKSLTEHLVDYFSRLKQQ